LGLDEQKCLTIIDDEYLSIKEILFMKSNSSGMNLTYEILKQILFKKKITEKPSLDNDHFETQNRNRDLMNFRRQEIRNELRDIRDELLLDLRRNRKETNF
jgi:hypothetical protein